MRTPTKVLGRRAVAWIVDGVLLWGLTLACFLAVATRGPAVPSAGTTHADVTFGGSAYVLDGGAAGLFLTLALAAWLLYAGVLPGVTGWTPGKRLAGIRLAGPGGSPPGAGRGSVRALFWVVDGFPYFLPGLVGFVVALASPRRQRVGDQVASTFVVRAGAVPESDARPLAGDAPPATAAAGWYADPRGEDRLRYWDGEGWTAHTAP